MESERAAATAGQTNDRSQPAQRGEPTRREDAPRSVTRREFVREGGAVAIGAALGLGASRRRPGAAAADTAGAPANPRRDTPPIARATLGRTGAEISILGLGTALLGHQNDNKPDVGKLVEVFSEAIDRGISYVDTARIYGRAEEALKQVLATRRERVFLATKVWAESAEKASSSLDASLDALGVDHVDLLHIHSLGSQDPDKVLGKGGSWEALLEAKAAGKTRWIGVTGHSRPHHFVRLLETGTVDVMMVVLNFVDRHIYGFEEQVLPVAREHGTGVLAMKVYGGIRGGFRHYSASRPHPSQLEPDLHRSSIAYVKSLEGVTGMVIGVHDRDQLEENIRRVAETRPLSSEDFNRLCERGRAIARGWNARFGPVS